LFLLRFSQKESNYFIYCYFAKLFYNPAMGEITNTPAFFYRQECARRKEITKKAEAAFFGNVVTTAARNVAEEIAKLTKFKGMPHDDVVYYNLRRLLESYLSDNPEIKSAMFASNASRPDKAIQALVTIARERYQKNSKSFHLSEATV